MVPALVNSPKFIQKQILDNLIYHDHDMPQNADKDKVGNAIIGAWRVHKCIDNEKYNPEQENINPESSLMRSWFWYNSRSAWCFNELDLQIAKFRNLKKK